MTAGTPECPRPDLCGTPACANWSPPPPDAEEPQS